MKIVHKSGPTLAGVVAAIKGIADVTGKVGWFEGSNYPNGTPVALVAATQEFGYPEGGIPPRPFMRPTIKAEEQAWTQGFANGYRAVLRSQTTPENVMEQVAGRAAGDVRKTISDLTSPPLNPATVAARLRRRGVKPDKATPTIAKPLVDTGQMLATLTHQVDKK